MLPLQDKNILLANLLPENPEPKQVVEFPKGQYVGGSNVIAIYKNNKLIGATTQLTPIQNVSGKYALERTTTNIWLIENDTIQIVGKQYIFNSVIFIDGFGWCGHDCLPEPQTLMDKTYRVLYAKPVGQTAEDFYLYDRVCLEVLTEKKNATTTNVPPTT